ncbi:hypothetical protein Hanom_Chr04g00382551 [Helianthus anomalus]
MLDTTVTHIICKKNHVFLEFNFVNNDQVLGNAKGAVAVVISILLFRNPVTVVGIAGYSMTVMGVVAYGEAKRRYSYQ